MNGAYSTIFQVYLTYCMCLEYPRILFPYNHRFESRIPEDILAFTHWQSANPDARIRSRSGFFFLSLYDQEPKDSLPTLFPRSAIAVFIVLVLPYVQCFWLISTVLIPQTNLYTLVSHYPIFPPRIEESVTQSTCNLVDIRTPHSAHRGNHFRSCFHSQGIQDPGKQLKTK